MDIKKRIEKFRMDRKGQVGLDIVTRVFLALFTLAVIGFAVIIALSSLNNSNALTAGSQEANESTAVLLNVTAGTAEFFSNTTTWLTLLSVVVIILIIAIVIIAVRGFSGTGRGSL